MRLVPLVEVAVLEIGEKIPAFKARVKAVYDAKSGSNDKGAWSVQNITVCDPANPAKEYKVKIWGQPEVKKSEKGSMLYFESTEGDRGPKGISVAHDDYKWKEGDVKKKLIEVKDTATITRGDGPAAPAASQSAPPPQSQPSEPPAVPAAQTAPQAEPAPAASVPASKAREVLEAETLAKAKQHIAKHARSLETCFDAAYLIARKIVEKYGKEFGEASLLGPEDIRAMAIHLNMDVWRAVEIDNLPNIKPNPKKEEAAKQ